VSREPKSTNAVGAVFGATYRLMAAPARVLASGAVEAVASPTAQRTLDEVFAGPLPEMIGRSLREHAVLERVAAEAFADPQVIETDVRALLQNPAVSRLLRDPEVEQLLGEVMRSPAVRHAVVNQSTSFGAEAAAAARRRARSLDAAVERPPRRLLRRPARAAGAELAYAGLITRAAAFVIDATVVAVAVVLASGLLELVASLFGSLRPAWVVGAAAGGAWLLAQVVYFAGFWTTIGQTPGMRLMGVRVTSQANAPPGLGRALLRLAVFVPSIVLCFAGFLPALVDDRRRGLPDLIAATVVVHVEEA
jgi:uncharacterized RDD family membrane protein YckC